MSGKSFSKEQIDKSIKKRDKRVEKELDRIKNIIQEEINNADDGKGNFVIKQEYKLKMKCGCQYCKHYHNGCRCYDFISQDFKKWNCQLTTKRPGCIRSYISRLVIDYLESQRYDECKCSFNSIQKKSIGSYKEYLKKIELNISFRKRKPRYF